MPAFTVVDPSPAAAIPTAIVLDPAEVADRRFELDLNSGPIRVAPPGPDWGDAEIQAYMADQQVGSSPVDYRIPNRQVKIPLTLGADSGALFEESRAALQAKVGLLQRQGGWLKRGSGLYADVVNATLTLPDQYSHVGAETDVVLALECLPDFYGDEKEGDAHEITGAGSFTEMIAGDHPCRARLIITDTSGEDQLGVMYHGRSRNFSAASTAAPFYDATSMTPLDAAAVDGGAVVHASVAEQWTPILSADVDGALLTHVGSYRVWAKVFTDDTFTVATPPSLRFLWDVGDFTNPTENDAVTILASEDHYIVDLGEIRLDEAPVGTHGWRGVIQAKSNDGTINVGVIEIYFQALDEAAGKVVSSAAVDVGLSTFELRDSFNQSAGDLDGQTADLGGDWTAATTPAGWFEVDDTRHAVVCTNSDDIAPQFATLGAARGLFAASVDLSHDGAPPDIQGLAFRYVDANNYATAHLTSSGQLLAIDITVAGGLSSRTLSIPQVAAGAVYTLLVAVDTGGRYSVWWGLSGQALQLAFRGYHAALADELATGLVGLTDHYLSADESTRIYDNFAVWTPALDAVVFANRAAEIRYDQVLRQAQTGDGYGKLVPTGDLLRLPPSGLENRPVELFVKTSRGDFDELPDLADDPATVQLRYRPCWLYPR